jgi:DNA polymerase-1
VRNSFLKKFPRFADKDGLIHASFNPAFQVTNRISVSKPPCSNIPRESEVRGMICSRFKEGLILSLDYRQLEMRLLASEAMEAKMLEIFESGKDVHDETAREMFGKDFTAEQRSLAKNINFGTVYGIEEWSFSRKFHVKVEDAKDWLARHKKIYPKIYDWMEGQHQFIRKNGWIRSRFGLVRRLPEAKVLDGEGLKAIFRQAGNFPIQSQGASITNLAGIELNKELEKMWEYEAVLYHIVHDSLNIDCPPDEAEKIEELGREVMEVRVPKLCQWLKVKLPVDSKLNFRWGGGQDE